MSNKGNLITIVDRQMSIDELMDSIFDEIDGWAAGRFKASRTDITKARIRYLTSRVEEKAKDEYRG